MGVRRIQGVLSLAKRFGAAVVDDACAAALDLGVHDYRLVRRYLEPGTGKSHLAQAIGQAVIQHGYKVLYRETHTLLDELADAALDGTRKEYIEWLVSLPLLILDDLGMRKLPLSAAEDLLEIIMRRYERASTIVTSNRPVED